LFYNEIHALSLPCFHPLASIQVQYLVCVSVQILLEIWYCFVSWKIPIFHTWCLFCSRNGVVYLIFYFLLALIRFVWSTSKGPCIQKLDVPWSTLIVTFNITIFSIWFKLKNEAWQDFILKFWKSPKIERIMGECKKDRSYFLSQSEWRSCFLL